jgi:hypothetical protein
MRELQYVRIVSTGALGSAVTGNIAACFFLPDPSRRPPKLGFVVWCFEECLHLRRR